jgi:hypothetical protein
MKATELAHSLADQHAAERPELAEGQAKVL